MTKETTDVDVLVRMLKANETSIFHMFKSLKRDRMIVHPKFLFIPGTRPKHNRILFVAHVDTVRRVEGPINLEISGGIIRARNTVLGADDRAGVAAMWLMAQRSKEHSLLLTDEEEIGGIGAREAATSITPLLAQHRFAIEADRWGDGNAVFYHNTEYTGFKNFLKNYLPSATFEHGSYTDIASICPAAEIPGINLSIGYMYQHTSKEILFVDAWRRAVEIMHKIAARKQYPKFKTVVAPAWANQWNYGQLYEDWGGYAQKRAKVVHRGKNKFKDKSLRSKIDKYTKQPKNLAIQDRQAPNRLPSVFTESHEPKHAVLDIGNDLPDITPKDYQTLYGIKPDDLIPLVGKHGNIVSEYTASDLTSYEWEFYDTMHGCINFHDILEDAFVNQEPLPRIEIPDTTSS